MDEKTRERVHQIARSLKELHLVATMDEALDRAKKIVESAEQMGKPMNNLMSEMKEESENLSKQAVHLQKESDATREELSSEAHRHRKEIESDFSSAEKSKSSAIKAKEDLEFDIKVHKLEKSDTEESIKETEDIACAAKDAEFIVKEAEKIQKKKK